MTSERRMRLLLFAFGGTAATFMAWSLWLIRSVGQGQGELAATVTLVGRMRDLEPSLQELEDVLSDTAGQGGSAVDEKRWTEAAGNYASRASRLPRDGEAAGLILRTDRCAQRILALGRQALLTPGTTEVRLARLAEARGHLKSGLAAVRESVQALLQTAAGISADLDRQRRQLDYIAFIACLLAALATALLELNRRDHSKLLAAENSLRGAHESLEARAQELVGANGRLQDEIAQRVRSENDLAKRSEELERSNAELERFAYVASHDLQEPLRAVASHVQILQEDYQGKLDADADESIRHAVEGAAHMRLLINDLLAFSRIGRRSEPLEPTSSEHALATAMRQLEVSIAESGARIVREEGMPEVLSDPTQLIQLFQNLIGNAIKFRGKSVPHVRIGVERKDAEWVFTVRDNGIGFDIQHAERIFAPFERLHGRHEYPGTGIGLAICKKIVERHGGRIWVESTPGEGSAFHFTLGRCPSPEIAAALPSTSPAPAGETRSASV